MVNGLPDKPDLARGNLKLQYFSCGLAKILGIWYNFSIRCKELMKL